MRLTHSLSALCEEVLCDGVSRPASWTGSLTAFTDISLTSSTATALVAALIYGDSRLGGGQPVSVIGGADVFALFLPRADRIELTEVLADIPGDTVMLDPRGESAWDETEVAVHAPEGDRPGFRFVTLERS